MDAIFPSYIHSVLLNVFFRSLCAVDEHGCGAGSLDVCPYELCRLGALSYILGFLKALFILNIGNNLQLYLLMACKCV